LLLILSIADFGGDKISTGTIEVEIGKECIVKILMFNSVTILVKARFYLRRESRRFPDQVPDTVGRLSIFLLVRVKILRSMISQLFFIAYFWHIAQRSVGESLGQASRDAGCLQIATSAKHASRSR
jgi:hypothetical protein